MTPIILAGGSGSRLWPKSRAKLPKQFLRLANDKTMLQETVLRLSGLPISAPLLVCNEDHRFIAAEQMQQLPNTGARILLEPQGKNTAPAICLSALLAQQYERDPLLLVLAADHVIQDTDAFHHAVRQATVLANEGHLVTFGIVPDSPNTGYGYIKQGNQLESGYVVDSFVEKPDAATAKDYLEQGNYVWNSGMFMFRASRLLEEMATHAPDILAACKSSIDNKLQDLDFVRVDAEAFAQSPEDSIDYAIMEKTDSAAVVPMSAGWNDVGSWESLWQIDSGKDADGNVLKGDVLVEGSQNCYVNAEERMVALVGVDDAVVIETKDAILVAAKDKVQNIKSIVSKLKQEKRSEFEFHREVFRPWGSYDSIDNGTRYQVKRISVKPGEKLSVQMHHHRAEHWIVVSGTAKVTNGDSTFLVAENESTYIPVGVVHALENPGKIPLELIEVQSGSYLGEDDIVRFSDRYGRAPETQTRASANQESDAAQLSAASTTPAKVK
ncbi:mannose-1-phosphate guanylyltransferase/mannose-6-phosphate isomerase [Fluctibacter corallii]|uniref:mannose-1-phosphate guanylyltransferase/mannose-6-phosphate isomerase n=1 Tax=Fluctibacter corallii TaxID=2984329 RepID=UPI00298268E3|nr:mannose-1-phosphate guanylyltransferase/mannose-6-phosphate isomerase [Aestuariibacter sp. AA17]